MERDFIVRAGGGEGSAGRIMQMMFSGVVRLEETGAGFFLPPSSLPPPRPFFLQGVPASLPDFISFSVPCACMNRWRP